MNENKKYYWLKLKEDFFEEDTINWLEEQENGKDYCLFYLKLCLKSLRTNGILIREVGEILIPYDAKKLGDITNTDIDTVRIAMELFKKIGLIQILDNGEIYLSQLNTMVGSETAVAERVRKYRENKKLLQCNTDVTKLQHRDRDRDKEIDIEIDKEKKTTFLKPTIQEIQDYCVERKNGINANAFYDFYESKNWYVGKNKMKDWKACIRTWEQRTNKRGIPEWVDKKQTKEIATREEINEIENLIKGAKR